MFGGAPALQGIGRVVWATDDPWGGSGRLLAWEDNPTMQQSEVVHCPGRARGRRLFAQEAKPAFPEEG